MIVRRFLVLPLVPLAAAAAIPGCGGVASDTSRASRWGGSIDTASDGRVTVRNTGGGAWQQDTVRARRTLLVGETGIRGGSEATTFGSIVGLAVDGRGQIFVGDRQSNTVRAFAPDGRHLGLVGKEGQGPGEFSWPNGLAFGPDDRLYVAETDGVTVMGSPAGGTLPKEQIDSWPTVTYPQVFRPFRVVCEGTVYYPHVDHDPTVQMYIRYGRDGTVRDTVLVPDLEGLPAGVPGYRTGPGGGRMVPGVDHPPLVPVPSWDVTATGNLLVGEARRYRLLVLGSRLDTLRVVRRQVDRRSIPEEIRTDSAEALRTRLDTLPVPLEDVKQLPEDVATVEIPERYAAHHEARVGRDGRFWVKRPPLRNRPDTASFDVFDRSGVFLGTLLVPGRFDPGRGYTNARSRARPVFTEDAVYGVVKDSTTGVQRIARFSYELPEREDGAPGSPETGCSGRGLDL